MAFSGGSTPLVTVALGTWQRPLDEAPVRTLSYRPASARKTLAGRRHLHGPQEARDRGAEVPEDLFQP
jgi:hypothetical protein